MLSPSKCSSNTHSRQSSQASSDLIACRERETRFSYYSPWWSYLSYVIQLKRQWLEQNHEHYLLMEISLGGPPDILCSYRSHRHRGRSTSMFWHSRDIPSFPKTVNGGRSPAWQSGRRPWEDPHVFGCAMEPWRHFFLVRRTHVPTSHGPQCAVDMEAQKMPALVSELQMQLLEKLRQDEGGPPHSHIWTHLS